MVLGENTESMPVQAVDDVDDVKVLCILRDMTDAQRCQKVNLNQPASMTAKEMIEDVAKHYNYVPDTFLLTYERPVPDGRTEQVILNEVEGSRLRDICADVGNGKKNNFTLNEKDDTPPKRIEGESGVSTSLDNLSLGYSSSTSLDNKDSHTSTNYGSTTNYSSSYSTDYSAYSYALIKSDTGYVGMVNQAMTCYLNSLIQTLYMTPEFRNAVYRWESDGKDPAKNIPFQLQKLFLQLQTSKRRAIETTDLTKSFGWDSSEAWQQHDVQELCRVMFDALETKWKNTDQADLINHLYQGKLKDYVMCMECKNESARVDAYLDIPLVIRPFGSTQAYGSVEEALDAFVQFETLDGANQYFCEKCNKKCDAHKGLRFVSFPYLLTLQLKRFDFDYSTMHRIKLNDKMTFPEILNLNHLVETEEGAANHVAEEGGDEESSMAGRDEETTVEEEGESAPAQTRESPVGEEEAAPNEKVDEGSPQANRIDEGIDVDSTGVSSDPSSLSEAMANDRNARDLTNDGPYVYELFSIMIHSGSAAGGHYYAYIKNLKDGRWYSFNDQHVTTITYDDIKKTYGGSSASRGYYSAAYTSSTNAYMLMYRKIDKKNNADFIQVSEFPDHLKRELDAIKNKEETDKKMKEMEKSMCKPHGFDIIKELEEVQRLKDNVDKVYCKIKLFCVHPVQKKQMETKLEVHKDKTLKEATEMAWKLMELEELVPLDCVRLVKYDEFHDSLEKSFEGEEDTPMSTLLGGVKTTYMFDLLLETKRPDQEFQAYKPGGVTVKVYQVHLDTETIDAPISVRAYLNQTVSEFKNIVAQALDINATNMRCVFERFYSDLRFLAVPNKTLKAEGFFKSNKVFVESASSPEEQEDPSTVFSQSKLFKILDRYENTIRLNITLPTEAEVQALKMIHYNKRSNMGYLNSNGLQQSTALVQDAIDKLSVEAEVRAVESLEPQDLGEGIEEGTEVDVYDRIERTKDYCKPNGDSSCASDSDSTAVNASDEINNYINDTVHKQSSNTDSNTGSSTPQSLETQTDRPCDVASEVQSPEENVKDITSQKEASDCWDMDEASTLQENGEEDVKRYFRATLQVNSDTGARTLEVDVDKRITLGALKRELVAYVGTSLENFKVYRVYSNNQEFESVRLSETLSSYGDDSRLNIKLGRALKKGEYRAKVYQLLINETEPVKLLFDAVFAKGMTVLESKQILQEEMKLQHNLEVPLDRIRLRKKTWRNPGSIFLDDQVYEDDIPIYANWELFVEVLDGPEQLTSSSQVSISVKRWRPSQFKLDPFQEVILNSTAVTELIQKVGGLLHLTLYVDYGVAWLQLLSFSVPGYDMNFNRIVYIASI
ncbi:ubiquitin carboxyl-terminal hydrolase 47 isoform X1 [Lingula anatina]|uniref:Ubiquitin carboxyl-terminal hydrolase 47 n=1 Tax=Lingula anatina TaxID=7574 RepID=A0A1S3I9G4_LINAN|nr:ubiquitin carboxyl-terminal hydrolase 47 isoform X1 [Lingula anatina]|eukprot:XP_013394501.1 ubiquitin carboxyl-terminal hydrolase 47 isoform X1 [Lingula anatina]